MQCNMKESHSYYDEWKKTNKIKEYILHDSLYVKFYKTPAKLQWQEADQWFHGDRSKGIMGKIGNTKEHKEISGDDEIILILMSVYMCVCVCVYSFMPNSLWPIDRSPSGSSVHGIFQARILEWLPLLTPGNLPDPGIKTASQQVICMSKLNKLSMLIYTINCISTIHRFS